MLREAFVWAWCIAHVYILYYSLMVMVVVEKGSLAGCPLDNAEARPGVVILHSPTNRRLSDIAYAPLYYELMLMPHR